MQNLVLFLSLALIKTLDFMNIRHLPHPCPYLTQAHSNTHFALALTPTFTMTLSLPPAMALALAQNLVPLLSWHPPWLLPSPWS